MKGTAGWRIPDGAGGQIVWCTNPKHHVWPESESLLDLFLTGMDKMAWDHGASGVSALRYLPDVGGLNDQSPVLLDAITVLSRAIRDWQSEKR